MQELLNELAKPGAYLFAHYMDSYGKLSGPSGRMVQYIGFEGSFQRVQVPCDWQIVEALKNLCVHAPELDSRKDRKPYDKAFYRLAK